MVKSHWYFLYGIKQFNIVSINTAAIFVSVWRPFNEPEWRFQQRIDSTSKSHGINQWLSVQNIQALDCPALTPDLNPL